MPLKQKYFVPFMISVGIAFTAWIVYTSFDYREELQVNFENEIVQNDSLVVWPFQCIAIADSTVSIMDISERTNKPSVLIFAASWSDKSINLLSEMIRVQEKISVNIFAAYVKDLESDAKESLAKLNHENSFYGVDGMAIYNQMRAPGIPSAIIFDSNAQFMGVAVGENAHQNIVEQLVGDK